MNKFKFSYLNPLVIYIYYWIFKLFFVLPKYLFFYLRKKNNDTKLCIEAGINGWKSIEFKEIYYCACEYLGEVKCSKLVVNPNKSYLQQVKEKLKSGNYSHYFFDPRTGSQKFLLSFYQTCYLSVYFYFNNITPIVLLTDFSVRRWRIQSSIITSNNGIIITYLDVKRIKTFFPHNRILGPYLMPFSKKTFSEISQIEKIRIDLCSALFIGSLYEPRRTILSEINEGLKKSGNYLKIIGRELGGQRVSDSDYWSNLVNGGIIVTTAVPVIETESPDLQDLNWIPQLVYRYIEAIACRSLLIAPEVPGVRKYFIPGEHFVKFDSTQEAVDNINYYLKNKEECDKIIDNGYSKVENLINSNFYWLTIDAALGPDGLL
jgi:hypothetical protein